MTLHWELPDALPRSGQSLARQERHVPLVSHTIPRVSKGSAGGARPCARSTRQVREAPRATRFDELEGVGDSFGI